MSARHLCSEFLCKRDACYGYRKGDGLKCKDHRSRDMYNVIMTCEYEGCRIGRSYGYPIDDSNFEYRGVPRFCSRHKLEGMINLINKKCEQVDCKKRAFQGYIGDKNVRFCADHRLEGMTDLVNKLCAHEGCKKHPSYGYYKKPIYCVEHSLDGMINVKYNKFTEQN